MSWFDRRWMAAVLAAASYPAAASGQLILQLAPNRVPAAREGNESSLDGQRMFVEDRTMTRRMRIAQRLLQEGSAAEGLDLLQRILDHPEDFPFNPQEGDRSHFRSLKAEAASIIAALPAEQRKLYEQQAGSAARRILKEAVAAGSVRQLEEVARRFFHTEAGYEAADRLGTHLLDRAEPLAAALHFDRLRKIPQAAEGREPMLSLKAALCWARAGFPEESRAALVDAKHRAPRDRIVVGERTLSLFGDDEQALAWLAAEFGGQRKLDTPADADWPLFRGNAARAAAVASASPIWEPQWQVSTITRPRGLGGNWPPASAADEFAAALRKQLETRRQSGALTIPAVHPLVVGDVVVYRTPSNLRAVDFATGKSLWETEIDRTYQKILEGKEDQPNPQVYGYAQAQNPRDAFLGQRVWDDLTAGTLSSDGRYVFAVEGLGYVNGIPQLQMLNRAGVELPTKDFNKLMAFDAATGKLKWEIGGQPGEAAIESAGAFFLGPPLPLGGRLYCLVQDREEVRLQVLDPATGRSEWSQLIAVPGSSIQHPVRRTAGVSPSYHDGVLICPTGSGAVVAIDPGRRTLMWAYRYESNVPQNSGDVNALFLRQQMLQGQTATNDDESRWIDCVATIAEGKVLLAPRDSDELHCLSLADGQPLWAKPRPRQQGLYLAAVFEGKGVVVGRTQVEAFRLADGSPAWEEPVPIPLPAGRGVRSGEFYHVPLTTGELATLDLRDGQLLARSPCPAGVVPGNLIAARGAIVSQTADSLLRLESLDVQRARILASLDKDPDDAEALGLRGSLALHEGDEERGLADLRRAVRGGAAPRARQLLVATLLEGLRHDFAAYRDSAEEIRELVEDPRQRSQFLRLHAAGLHKVGEQEKAFQEYLQMAGPETGSPELERLNVAQSVRSDRWVRPRIAAVHAAAAPAVRAQMNELLEAELAKAREAEGPDRLRRFLECFRDTPSADEARWELVERLPPGLAAELHLLELRASSNEETAGQATARLVRMLLAMERAADVPPLLDELEARWADVACLDGKTGRELAQSWSAEPQVAEALADRSAWPARRIAAQTTRRNQRANVQQMFPVDVEGPAGPFYEGWSFQLDQSQQQLAAHDPLGRKRWSVSIRVPQEGVRNAFANFARIHGHLIVVGFGSHFVVLDGLAAEKPKLLWHQALHDGGQQSVQVNRGRLPGGGMKMVVIDQFGRQIGSLGPICDDFICYQVGGLLTAADPLTGEPLWVRRNMPRGCELFGDDEFLVAVPAGGDRGTLLRGADGEELGERRVPGVNERKFAAGRRLLTHSQQPQHSQLSLIDVVTDEALWMRKFPRDIRMELVAGEELAVIDPAGRLEILSLADGKGLLDQKIEPIQNLSAFQVLRSRERYVLLTYDPTLNQQNNVQVIPINYAYPMVNGRCYGFDRATGKRLWSRMVAHQSLQPGQPQELPVLMLAARTYRRIQQGNRIVAPNQYQVLVLDVRSGETVVEEESQVASAGHDFHSDPAE
ncbi:MAG: PQQ-binding-like beta-propeller repeat protein, partial [Planctomycetales bacterium]